MGTEVLLKLQNTVLTRTFAAGEQLASNVYSTISSYQSQAGIGYLTVSSVLYTENKLPVENWEDRCVGLEPLTIVVEAQQTLQEQIASMLQRVQQLEAKVSNISKPRVANLAAQMLLLACGVEDFHATTTHHFSALGVQHPRVKAVSGFLGVQPRVFVTQANALVSRRNNIDIQSVCSHPFQQADIFVLTETWLTSGKSPPQVPGYFFFNINAKQPRCGRGAGGIAVYCANKYSGKIKIWRQDLAFLTRIWLERDKSLFQCNEALLLCAV